MRVFFGRTRLAAACVLSGVLLWGSCAPALAYDEVKTEDTGLVRGDLSTWTQRRESFEENGEISVNGSSSLSSMGCSYYATFFMLCKMGLRNQLSDTAWQLAVECASKGLSREGTGYFDPPSISELTDGRAEFVTEGNYDQYYEGQAAIANCESTQDVIKLLRHLTQEKGYFCVCCVVGTATSYSGSEYYSEGHYIFIDQVLKNGDMVIGDPAFPGTKWSDNWGEHDASIVKIYAYKLLDENGNQVHPSQRQSMYVERSYTDY